MLVKLVVSVIAIIVMLAAFARAETKQPEIAWRMDLSDKSFADKLTGKSLFLNPGNRETNENFSVTVADGVLRITAKYGIDGVNQGDNVHFDLPIGGSIDLTKFPVFEVEWRTTAPKPAGCLLVQNTCVTRTGDDASSYYYPSCGATNEWHTDTNQFVPDASFPTSGTPVTLKSVYLAIYAWANSYPGEYTLEIRSFKIRGFNEAEAAADAPKVEVFKNFKQIPATGPLVEDVFPFGPCGYCRGPEGYESWYDNDVRCHTTVSTFHYSQFPDEKGVSRSVPASDYVAFRKRELEPAKARGLYIMPMLTLPDVVRTGGVESLPWLRDYAATLAKAFKNEPYLAGWFIGDETSDDFLWGIAATGDALHRADPSKLAMYNHFGIERIMRFEPYLNMVMTDYYPIHTTKRDPWGYAKWCRTLSEKTDKPQWIFIPAFGQSDWFKTDSSYAYPTHAELRLMSYLALANGIKGITYFLYSTPNMFPGVFDQIGNALPLDDPIVKDISEMGEKMIEIGPFLLKTKLLPLKAASATPADASGLSVGVRQSNEGKFVVVVNQSVDKEQGGNVNINIDDYAGDAAMYDLYTLKQLTKPGETRFEVAPLAPGDGRIYYRGNKDRFEAVKKMMLQRRALEIVRVANLDRLVAQRWGMDVKAIDAQFAKAKSAARTGGTAQAQKAEDMVAAIVKGDSDMAKCRRVLADARMTLGRAYLTVHSGYNTAWPGCEAMLDAPINLWNQFGPLQEDYYLGKKDGLTPKLQQILTDAQALLDKAKTSRTDK